MSNSLHLDFDVAAGGEREVHQAVDGFGGRFENVDETFVDAHFELFAALFVDMRAFDDGKGALAGRQWNGACQGSAGTQSCVDNLLGGLINNLVVISL